MLLPDIHLYSLFLMKLHPFTLFVLIYFALNQILKQVEKIILWKNNQRAHRVDFGGKNYAFPLWQQSIPKMGI